MSVCTVCKHIYRIWNKKEIFYINTFILNTSKHVNIAHYAHTVTFGLSHNSLCAQLIAESDAV
jgi:hypothetical protein